MRRGVIAVGLVVMGIGLLFAWTFDADVHLRSNDAQARGEAFWSEATPAASLPGRPGSFADLAEKLSPTVVNIKASQVGPRRQGELLEEFFGGPRRRPRQRPNGTGTGFVISKDGYLVTNNHVIEGADRISVVFEDGTELDAEVVGRDARTDLALLKVDAHDALIPAPLGDSDEVRVGDWVMAIGNPFGLDHTVTVGILSARGRDLRAGPYDDFLQTDASINPGNSGGPLIDLQGRVIGINTAINREGQGIGFAIPINMAKDLLPQLRDFGAVTRGWLGVQIQRVTPALAESFELDEPTGALIGKVFPDSPAASANLKHGDVILEFDGVAIENFDDLPRRVAATPPGSEVEILVMREGKQRKLSAKLEEMPSEDPIRKASGESSHSEDWGFEARNLTDELAERLDLPDDSPAGVVIVGVDAGSPAEEAGLRPNDVILEANKETVANVDELEKALEASDDKVMLRVQRGDGSRYVVVEKF